jgi:hypothetical protein
MCGYQLPVTSGDEKMQYSCIHSSAMNRILVDRELPEHFRNRQW